MTTSRSALGLIAVLAFACGGKTAGDGVDGGGGSTSGGVSSSGADAGTTPHADGGGTTTSDAGVVVTHPEGGPVGITCQQGAGGGSGGNGSCEFQVSETCSDGSQYTVACQCPQATCTCSQSSANGGSSGGGFSYDGCPSCSTIDVWEICGFPH